MPFDPIAYALAKKKILLTQKKYDANLDGIIDLASIPSIPKNKLLSRDVLELLSGGAGSGLLSYFSDSPNVVFIGFDMEELLASASGISEIAEGNVSATKEELTIVGGTSTATGTSEIYWDLGNISRVYVRVAMQSVNARYVAIRYGKIGGTYVSELRLEVPATTADFYLWRSGIVLASEAVDLSYGTYHDIEYAYIYFDAEGNNINRHIVYRDGVKKFDVLASIEIANFRVAFKVYDDSTTTAQSGKFKGLVVIVYE